MHPVKGLATLVRAWNRVRVPDWHLVIAGPDEGGYRRTIEKMIADNHLEAAFSFMGPVDEADKWGLYEQAELLVLPSLTENFGMVVAEALASGKPVITTRGTPWEMLAQHHCGWWIDVGVEPLADALREATALSDHERAAMGERGRRLVEARFSWPKIADQTLAVYRWV